MLVVLLSVIGITAEVEETRPFGTVFIETEAVTEPFRCGRPVSEKSI